MTPAQTLEHYRQQIERLNEINEARQAREDALRVQVEALKVRADWLTQQLAALKQGVQP
ncbi:hypothetical protein [Aquabacterium sp. A08]|uniref:hypothetical protein n=1 Tax=Aquabacterium sp. A08 TaxID=2718532 RepID=UPI001424420C|nr:hypothetical protein [Aquabacterium sp. A08]NIC43320.1 hypothetical protein [Aquabacterium sp. A08]